MAWLHNLGAVMLVALGGAACERSSATTPTAPPTPARRPTAPPAFAVNDLGCQIGDMGPPCPDCPIVYQTRVRCQDGFALFGVSSGKGPFRVSSELALLTIDPFGSLRSERIAIPAPTLGPLPPSAGGWRGLVRVQATANGEGTRILRDADEIELSASGLVVRDVPVPIDSTVMTGAFGSGDTFAMISRSLEGGVIRATLFKGGQFLTRELGRSNDFTDHAQAPGQGGQISTEGARLGNLPNVVSGYVINEADELESFLWTSEGASANPLDGVPLLHAIIGDRHLSFPDLAMKYPVPPLAVVRPPGKPTIVAFSPNMSPPLRIELLTFRGATPTRSQFAVREIEEPGTCTGDCEPCRSRRSLVEHYDLLATPAGRVWLVVFYRHEAADRTRCGWRSNPRSSPTCECDVTNGSLKRFISIVEVPTDGAPPRLRWETERAGMVAGAREENIGILDNANKELVYVEVDPSLFL